MNLPLAFHRRGAARDLDDLLPELTAAFAATAAEHDRRASFPFENFTRLHGEGLLALTAPVALGGGAAGLPTALKVIEAVARGEPSTALVLATHYAIHAALAGWPGFPEHLKAALVRDAILEGALASVLRDEPARGGLPATIARRAVDGWRLSGRKTRVAGAPGLGWMLVCARTDEAAPRVGCFLVPRAATRWRIEESPAPTGLRASRSDEVVFEGTPLLHQYALAPRPASAPLPAPDPVAALWTPVLTAAVYQGVAGAARDWVVRFAVDPRTNLGAIDGLLQQNRTLLDAVAEGRIAADQAGLVKHRVIENAIAAVERAIAAAGDPGPPQRDDLLRHHRDVLCGRARTLPADSTPAALSV